MEIGNNYKIGDEVYVLETGHIIHARVYFIEVI